MSITGVVLACILLLCALLVLLPIIKWDTWVIRIWDYPRLQGFALVIIFSVLLFFLGKPFGKLAYVAFSFAGLAIVYLVYLILPYTFLGKKEVVHSTGNNRDARVSIMVGNVYQYNDQYNDYVEIVKKYKPDIVFLVETDKKWEEGVKEIEKDYPFLIKKPFDNTYGLLFYSNLDVKESEVHYLVEEDKPSVEVVLELRNGRKIKVYGVHPAPPVYPLKQQSTERDAEILEVAKKAEKEPLPAVVIGDLNDVAWSYTTDLFLKTSSMLDPRKGRGFYNTFHAKYPFFRWPLDHVFCSKDFELMKIETLKDCGSDHFPFYIQLALAGKQNGNEEQEQPNHNEKENAEEKIEKGEKVS